MRGLRRRFGSGRSGWALVCLAVGAAALTACNAISNSEDTPPAGVFDKIRGMDLLPRFPEASETTTTKSGDGQRPATFYGTGATVAVPQFTGAQPAAGGQAHGLNFENAPVTTVAKVILGDILGVGYIIDPRVQGTVSLASGRPVPKADILFVLESALRVSNVALVRESRGYRLIPAPEAMGNGTIDAD